MIKKIFIFFLLGLKYLYRYRRRYIFLLAALVFCFAVVTLITSIRDGMYDNVYFSAQTHYAGDIIATGYISPYQPRYLGRTEIDALLKAASAAGIPYQYTVKRTFANNCVVHFNGAALELKYLQGCDWENEKIIFGRMNFTEPPPPDPGDDGLIISAPAAAALNIKIGDSIIVEIDTNGGQRNTGNFVVRGIAEDSSIFGYLKAYVSRLALNRLLLNDDDDASIMGFFLDDPKAAERDRRILYDALKTMIQTGPLTHNREELDKATDYSWQGNMVFLLTLPVYLSEISNLLDAMNIITYFLYAMMLLLILVSAVVTYRLILHERTREMGVMRTLGFYGRDLGFVLWTEVITLGVCSLAAGFIFAWLAGRGISLLSFSRLPGFEIFLRNGKLTAMFLPVTILINVVSVFMILFAAAIIPAFRASRKNLAGLLSGEAL